MIRRPRALAPWVTALWASDEPVAPPRLERLVPSGGVHLVVRLDGPPATVLDEDGTAHRFSAVVGGARSRAHLREAAGGSAVGVMIRPGAAGVVLGAMGCELAGRHTALDALWGAPGARLRDRLLEEPSAGGRLRVIEAELAARLAPRLAPHPAVASALEVFATGHDTRIEPVRRRVGLSHRRFVELFRRDVGLSPKAFCQVRRVGRVIDVARKGGDRRGWADLAAELGFSDQPHLTRTFRAVVGVPPAVWARTAGAHPHHVPVVSFVQDARRRRA